MAALIFLHLSVLELAMKTFSDLSLSNTDHKGISHFWGFLFYKPEISRLQREIRKNSGALLNLWAFCLTYFNSFGPVSFLHSCIHFSQARSTKSPWKQPEQAFLEGSVSRERLDVPHLLHRVSPYCSPSSVFSEIQPVDVCPWVLWTTVPNDPNQGEVTGA